MTRTEKYKDLRNKSKEENFKPLLNKDFYDLTKFTYRESIGTLGICIEIIYKNQTVGTITASIFSRPELLKEFSKWLESPYKA